MTLVTFCYNKLRIAPFGALNLVIVRLISLNNQNLTASFESALWSGIASDGGLFVPESFPAFTDDEKRLLTGMDLPLIAQMIIAKWLDGEIPDDILGKIVSEAINFEVPLREVGPFMIAELFHGPTMAFKDVAARFLAGCMEYFSEKENKEVNVIVATSGDTGGAVANAFSGLKRIQVFILFPKGKVSDLQYEQLTRVDANVIPIEVEGTFDDCQRLVKQALNDRKLELPLSSANSINIARLLPQSSYYAYVYSRVGSYQAIVPTGNLGNATAGLIANRLGIGPDGITLACNANDSLARYAVSGTFRARESIETLSNAMDVGNPNNFPRYLYFLSNTFERFTDLTEVISVDDDETADTIKRVYSEYNYVLDPHTAVAWRSAELSRRDSKKVIFATASPLKFAREIKEAAGISVDNSRYLDELMEIPTRKVEMSADYQTFAELLVRMGRG